MSGIVECINSGRLVKESFLFSFLSTQIKCLLTKNAKGFRYPDDVRHFATSVMYIGGRGLLQFIRGDGARTVSENGDFDPKRFGLFLPSPRILRKYKPLVKIYGTLSQANINRVAIGLPPSCTSGGLVFDEMEIRHGLVYQPHLAQLVGLVSGEVPEKDVNSRAWKDANVNKELATKVLQVFFVSTDGKTSVPLGFHPTTGISGKEMADLMIPIIKTVAEFNVTIEWGSSDGFSSNMEFISQLKKMGLEFYHVFDVTHIEKNLRNTLENKEVLTRQFPKGFSLRTLDNLRDGQNGPAYRKLFPHTVFPKDKMDVQHFKRLIDSKLLELLKDEVEDSARGLFEYLGKMKDLYDGFMDNSMDHSLRFEKLSGVTAYFTDMDAFNGGLGSIGSNLKFQIVESIANLAALHKSHGDLLKPSTYGTLIVENFFSQVRAKVRYPNLLEYATHNYDA